jgi:multiple sugar transport system substrate-binding protein
MKKKLLCSVLTAAMAASVLSGCSGGSKQAQSGGSSSKEKVELTFMSWNGGNEKTLNEQAMKSFTEKNPNVTIKPQFLAYDQYSSKLNTLMAANSAPDIFFLQEFLTLDWGQKGVLEDLAPRYTKAGINADEVYLPSALAKTKDNIWGIANGMATVMLYYNKPLFTKLGLPTPSTDPANPWTWDQFLETAKKLTVDRSGKHPDEAGFDERNIKTFGTTAPTGWLFQLPFIYSNGGSIATEDGKQLNIDSPESVEALQGFADLMYKYKVAPTAVTGKGLPTNVEMFKNEQLGMAIGGIWEYGNFATEKFDVGIGALPSYKKATSIAWSAHYCLSAKSKHKDEAFAFLSYFMDPSTNPLMLEINMPIRKDYYSGENMKKWSDKYSEEFVTVVPKQLTQYSVIPENVTLKNFGKIMDQTVYPALDKAWTNQGAVQDVMKDMKAKTNGMLEGRWDK